MRQTLAVETTPPEPRTLSFLAVNGWRGPGALAIAVAHFSVAADFLSYEHLAPVSLLVDLFFVLSGLVIAQTYADKLSHASAFPEYLVRRFGRIWPLQAATLSVLVAYELFKLLLQWTGGRHFSSPPFSPDGLDILQAIPTNLLLIHSLGIHDRETWVFPSWSLSVEFATYISFAAFCLVKPLLRRALIVATIAASLAVLIFIAPYHMRSTFDYGLFRCFAGFFAGTLCYDVAKRWRPKWPLPTLFEIAAIALVLSWMSLSTGSLMAFAAPLVFCAFVLAFMGNGGMISRVLRSPPFQVLAELSFAIYMVHALVLTFIFAGLHEYEKLFGLALFHRVPNPLAGGPGAAPVVEVLQISSASLLWILAIVYVSAVMGAAYAAYRFIEVPGRAFFGRVAKRLPSSKRHLVSRLAAMNAAPERAP